MTTDKPTFMTHDREVELRRALWAAFEGKESSKERIEACTTFCRSHKLHTWEGEGMFVNGYSYGLSLIHISEPTRPILVSRMPSSA
mgnify:CR=1 FL=1